MFEIFRPGNEPPVSEEEVSAATPAENTENSSGPSVRPDDLF